MFQKFMTGALIAGGAAGLLAAFLHFAFVQEYILLGERYEFGEVVHFEATAPAMGTHDHAPDTSDMVDQAAEDGGHDHSRSVPEEGAGMTRDLLTVAFTALIYISYAMLMTAGFGIAAQLGLSIGATQGALWGLAGYAAFQLAPAMGLPPELPGTVAVDLSARQVWWWGTVCGTGIGIALIAYSRNLALVGIGALLIAAPHIVGAPRLDEFYSYAPAEVGAAFSARVLGVGLAVWVVMGWLAGRLWAHGQET